MTKRLQWIFAAVTLIILGAAGLFLWRTGFFSSLSSSASVQNYLNRFTPFAQCFFFLIQLMSVVFAPIPSNITALAGAVLFGLWESFLLTYAAVLLGSIVVFSLARILGRSFTDRIINKKISEKYLKVIQAKQDVFLILVFLLPFFPDDIICMIAGLTNIRPLRFFTIALLARPWGLLVASAVGSATVSIPLWAMILLGICGLVFFVIGLKYGDKWENQLISKFKRQ